jgi:hypothetical protein
LSHKNFALGVIVVLFSVLAVTAVLLSCYSVVVTINPVAAVTAATVAAIGMIWFKKSNN